MKKIGVIATGGTISAIGSDRFDFMEYKTGSLTIEEMIKQIPEINKIAYVETSQITNFSSCDLTPIHWLTLKKEVEEYVNDPHIDGVIVTQGTSTIEETAYFLHLTVATSKPIVLVGAQRPFSAVGSDAMINMMNAFRVATSVHAKEKGVLVIANDMIHSARDVTKTSTYRVEGFCSGEFGALGFVDVDKQVHFYRSPIKKHTIHSKFATNQYTKLPNVGIVYSYAGADGALIDHIVQSGIYEGIVIAGTGAGRFSEKEKQALIRAVHEGITVVRSSRVANGRVVPLEIFAPYYFIAGDNLSPQKARILLMLSLSKLKDPTHIQYIFNTY